MRAVNGRGVRVLLCAVAIVLGVQAAAPAKGEPPNINAILGTYATKYKQVLYNFDNGIYSTWNWSGYWEITPVSSTEVQVYASTFDETFRAHYENGVLIWGNGDEVNDPSHDVQVGYAVFSGSLGKVSMKGTMGYNSFGFWDLCDTVTLSGKMTFSTFTKAGESQSAGHGVSAAGEDDSPGVETTASSATFPGIDDILGDYYVKIKGTKYHVPQGLSEKASVNSTFRVEKIDGQTVVINTGGSLIRAHYRNGILLVAKVDDSLIADNSMYMLLTVKGSPGKTTWKGWSMSTRDIGTSEGDVDVATFSAKQAPDF